MRDGLDHEKGLILLATASNGSTTMVNALVQIMPSAPFFTVNKIRVFLIMLLDSIGLLFLT